MTATPVHICLTLYLIPVTIWFTWRYSHRILRFLLHTGSGSPKQAYVACHTLLDRIVLHAWELLPTLNTQPPVSWMGFTVSQDGLLVSRAGTEGGLVPITPWSNVSGVGLEMRPLYEYDPATRSYWHEARRVNTGYQFSMLVVLMAGSTLNIVLPLRDNEAAVDFAAHVLAFARSHERRLSLMGFEKDITRSVVHLEAF